MKTLSVTFYPSRKFILTKYLQKYDLSIQSDLFDWTFKKIFLLLNVNENCLQVQTRIITLDHFHSSLYRKQLFWNQVKFRKHVKISCLKWTIVVKENFRGWNLLLSLNIHSSELYSEPSWTSMRELSCEIN